MNGGAAHQNELATFVRNWVHQDNLASNLSKQASNSRRLRDEFENKIVDVLKTQNMENAVIQVAGAKLQLCQEKSMPTLTIERLREQLHSYQKRKGQMADETDQIMNQIKQQKQANQELCTKLKKTPNSPMPPPLPPQLQ